MRVLFFMFLLVLPLAAKADSAPDESGTLASLTQAVQQLRAENEKLSARISALEGRFPSGQKIKVTDHFGQPPIAPPSLPDANRKP